MTPIPSSLWSLSWATLPFANVAYIKIFFFCIVLMTNSLNKPQSIRQILKIFEMKPFAILISLSLFFTYVFNVSRRLRKQNIELQTRIGLLELDLEKFKTWKSEGLVLFLVVLYKSFPSRWCSYFEVTKRIELIYILLKRRKIENFGSLAFIY